FWQGRFGGAPDVIGRAVTIDRVPFTIIGVTPSEFFGAEVGRRFDVLVPFTAESRVHGPEGWTSRSLANPLTVMVRLRPRQTVEAANAALRGVQAQIREATLPDSWPDQFRAQYMKEPLTLLPISAAREFARWRYSRPLL